MGEYFVGDVVLAPIRIGGRPTPKTRPAIVTGICDNEALRVCPVTSKEPGDTPFKVLDLLDFASGGLDLFDESYALVSEVCTIRKTDVVGKKGRLTEESLTAILARVPGHAAPKRGRHR
ncbi:type II toxin-antitoxin system PemK/MazF family toxin [uncultured Methanofollis sp.]|uniref:type II toxin-antitoxin system PemK/MazF family toxin n=1 Tax=uncultured Methanofollis sp. TaxID=262500 RepID=UPI00262EF68C|nr:type II toxin-antitoxin system PemK/MazF family toxin [uncultured Methanofollis sp.]